MATDKEYSTNDEVNRSEEFQKKVELKEIIIDYLKETLVSVTDSVFKKAGYTKNEKNAGEYGDGSKYGAGAVSNQYIVKVAGKTKSVLTKKIIMDGKSISSDIEIVYKDNVIEFNYLTTEQGFFRGIDKEGNGYTVNNKFALDSKDMTKLKSELKSKLEKFAEKELGYITSTKIGVADKSNKSTSSVVENINNMKKLTIKELFEMDMDDSIEPNSDKIQGLNTLDLKDTNPPIDSDKQLFFDDKEINETGEWDDSDAQMTAWKDFMEETLREIESITNGKLQLIGIKGFDKYQGPIASAIINGVPYKIWTVNDDSLWIENFPFDNTSQKGMKAGFEGSVEEIADAVEQDSKGDDELKNIPGTNFSMNEITTAGPAITDSPGGYKNGAQSGAGGYNTKNAFKATPYSKAQNKRPKVTHDYKVVSQNESEDSEDKKDNNKKNTETKKSSSTTKLQDVTPKNNGKDTKIEQPSNKNSAVMEPNSEEHFNPKTGNENWKDTNQTNAPKSSNDNFWTEVDLEPGTGYIPKGMKQNYVAGMHDRVGELKKMGLAENNQPDLTKKKFFSLDENKKLGVNKRYLITEKTTDEYEKERFKKLSNFKSRETIKEAEEMNNFFDSLQEEKDSDKVFTYKKSLTENVSYDDIFNDSAVQQPSEGQEDTIEVEKPGSKFGTTYKFFKDDFLNESKTFILDLNSRVYVKNPNTGISTK